MVANPSSISTIAVAKGVRAAAGYIQIRCRDLAVHAAQGNTPLSSEYRRLSRIWFWLGVVGFTSVWILVGLMVMKPRLDLAA